MEGVVELVVAADMIVTDENLRNSAAKVEARVELLLGGRVSLDVSMVKGMCRELKKISAALHQRQPS